MPQKRQRRVRRSQAPPAVALAGPPIDSGSQRQTRANRRLELLGQIETARKAELLDRIETRRSEEVLRQIQARRRQASMQEPVKPRDLALGLPLVVPPPLGLPLPKRRAPPPPPPRRGLSIEALQNAELSRQNLRVSMQPPVKQREIGLWRSRLTREASRVFHNIQRGVRLCLRLTP